MDLHTKDNKNNNKQSKPKTKVNISNCLNDIPFEIARPLATSMTVFGLLHVGGKDRRWAPITKIYATAVLLLFWAMFIRMFVLYGSEGFGPVLIGKIVLHAWTFMSAVAATMTYISCRSQNKLMEFLTRWAKLLKLNRGCVQAFGDVTFHTYVRKAKLSFYSCLILSWLGIVVTCLSIGYSLFQTSNLDFLISPIQRSHPQALLLKCFLFAIFVYMAAAWMFTLCLFYDMGSVIYEEFRIFHEDFENAVHPHKYSVDVGIYRRRHQEICLLVEEADGILSGFSGICIVVCTLQVMLLLYNMLWYSDYYNDMVVLATSIFWLLSVLVYLGVIAVGGGYLNHMAHAPLKTIHKIQMKTISTEISFQIAMFISKLTGGSIGLTAMGMFVIDKPTILTIAGGFLTYFVVLAQFKQPSDLQEVQQLPSNFGVTQPQIR